MTVWVADGERGLMRGAEGGFARVGPPGSALCCGGGRVYCAGPGGGWCCDGATGRALFDFPVPPGVCALCLFRGMVCALSTEADCVAACDGANGEMLYTAPAGAYPRAMCAQGRLLAVAGGAAGEVLLLDETLRPVERFRVPGTACGVCFLPRGLGVLCAVGEEEPASLLMCLSRRAVAEELYSDPRPPASLCALEGGKCLVGCSGGVTLLRPEGSAAGRWACAYPARLRAWGDTAAVCDSWQGEVRLLSGRRLYRGGEPLDVLMLPTEKRPEAAAPGRVGEGII